MTNVIQVVTTTASEDEAQRIASALIERRLAACVQMVGPITSTYRWQGAVETSQEWQCVIKTRGDLFAEVEAAIIELHSYDVPEVLAMSVVAGRRNYLDWVASETGGL
jgi:periplasmic divalent cation tolerance protein